MIFFRIYVFWFFYKLPYKKGYFLLILFLFNNKKIQNHETQAFF